MAGQRIQEYEHTLAITKDGPRILTSQGEEGTY